eukprot:4711896-Heterocapsa_arctica.AAC.1
MAWCHQQPKQLIGQLLVAVSKHIADNRPCSGDQAEQVTAGFDTPGQGVHSIGLAAQDLVELTQAG